MAAVQNINLNRPFWYFLSTNDYSPDKFNKNIDKGYWNYYEGRVKRDDDRNTYLGYLNRMKCGDKVAIYNIKSEKSDEFMEEHQYQIYQKNVPYIVIKAIGEITQPCKDGKTINMSCQHVNDSRKWYKYSYRAQIWMVLPKNKGGWGKNLIDFTFNGAAQDLTRLKYELTEKKKG